MLPPGLSNESTNEAANGSVIPANTIGISVVASATAWATGVVTAKIKSG